MTAVEVLRVWSDGHRAGRDCRLDFGRWCRCGVQGSRGQQEAGSQLQLHCPVNNSEDVLYN